MNHEENCENFLKDLLKFSKEIIWDMPDQQWKKFEIFFNQCINKYLPIDNEHDNPDIMPHLNLRTEVLKELNKFEQSGRKVELIEFEQSGKELLKLLVNIMNLIYQHLFPNSDHFEFFKAEYLCYNTYEANQVLTAFDCKSDYMKLLINLDLLQELPDSDSMIDIGIRKNLYNLISLRFSMHFNKESVLREIVESGKTAFFYNNYLGGYKRMYLATVAIRAILLKLKNEENKANECIYCLRMYFAATQEPLLTINEVRSMLYPYFIYLERFESYEPYCKEFLNLMPECPVTFEPRTLTHLARYQIRKCLGRCNLPLPAAVEKLTIPKQLKSFVLGDVIEKRLSHRSRNNSLEHHIITMPQLLERWLEYKQETCYGFSKRPRYN